jgi:hypothetical protein
VIRRARLGAECEWRGQKLLRQWSAPAAPCNEVACRRFAGRSAGMPAASRWLLSFAGVAWPPWSLGPKPGRLLGRLQLDASRLGAARSRHERSSTFALDSCSSTAAVAEM